MCSICSFLILGLVIFWLSCLPLLLGIMKPSLFSHIISWLVYHQCLMLTWNILYTHVFFLHHEKNNKHDSKHVCCFLSDTYLRWNTVLAWKCTPAAFEKFLNSQNFTNISFLDPCFIDWPESIKIVTSGKIRVKIHLVYVTTCQ